MRCWLTSRVIDLDQYTGARIRHYFSIAVVLGGVRQQAGSIQVTETSWSGYGGRVLDVPATLF
jgi:hypothetical protein